MRQYRVIGLSIGLLLLFSGRLAAQTSASKPASSQVGKADRDLFAELLGYYKKYPQLQKEIGGGLYKFPDLDPQLLQRLSPDVLLSRVRQFNGDYKAYKAHEEVMSKQLLKLEQDIKKMPISDTQNRALQEVKIESLKGKMNQNRKVTVMLSIQANESFVKAVGTLSSAERKIEAPEERPNMPGVYRGSSFERQKMAEVDKLNLTPVDPEFYDTQLGKKLEADLRGRADYWSYDYAQDELYVKVNDEVGKLRVFKDASGTRFIRTRAGADFMEPRGKDEPVDMLNAKGKFLTGNGSEETLFGDFPDTKPKILDENKIRHGSGSSDPHHGHSH